MVKKQASVVNCVAEVNAELHELQLDRVEPKPRHDELFLANEQIELQRFITESVEARAQLVAAKSRLELALEASSAGTWELHCPSMRFVLDNNNQRLANAIPSGFSGTYQSFIDLVHEDNRIHVDRHFRRAINRESDVDVTARFADRKGHMSYASIRGRLVKNAVMPSEKRFVGIMLDVTEKKRLQELARCEEEQRQKDMTITAMQTEEKERKRISEILHDGVSQLLYGIKLHVNDLDGKDPEAAKRKLNELLDQAIRETRNISFELAPATLADFGLAATIEELCYRLSTSAMQIKVYISGFKKCVDLMFETAIFA